jgi:ABC-type dipeptide/oligopeptide/nickel transport system permease component
MRRYVLSRLASGAVIVLCILVLNFVIVHLVPGDPLHALLGDFPVPPGYAEQVRAEFGLDKPLAVQLGVYLWNLAQGNLGFSFANRSPVLDLILARMGPTMLLMLPPPVPARCPAPRRRTAPAACRTAPSPPSRCSAIRCPSSGWARCW